MYIAEVWALTVWERREQFEMLLSKETREELQFSGGFRGGS